MLLVIVGVIALGGGVYYYQSEVPKNKESITTPAETPEELGSQEPVSATKDSSAMKKEDGQETTTTKTPDKKVEQKPSQQKLAPSQAPTPLPTVVTPSVPSCSEDKWECGEWAACSQDGIQSRECNMVDNCPIVETPKLATQRSCTPSIVYESFLERGSDVVINPLCNQNQFTVGFVLIAPDVNGQDAQKSLALLQKLRSDFEKYFQEATYKLASVNVTDILVTSNGADANSGNVNTIEATKELIITRGDKFDFVATFTTYDSWNNGHFDQSYFPVRNNVKNIGVKRIDNSQEREIFDGGLLYGSEGKLKGVSSHDDIMLKLCDKEPNINGTPCGVGGLLHELGHQWCCYVGDNFTGNNSGKLGIIQESQHFYQGLDTYPNTADPLGSYHWIQNNDGTYRAQIQGYAVRYHPIFLYFMGLLPKYEYDTKFHIFNAGIFGSTLNINRGVKYQTVSVNDVIKITGERVCTN